MTLRWNVKAEESCASCGPSELVLAAIFGAAQSKDRPACTPSQRWRPEIGFEVMMTSIDKNCFLTIPSIKPVFLFSFYDDNKSLNVIVLLTSMPETFDHCYNGKGRFRYLPPVFCRRCQVCSM